MDKNKRVKLLKEETINEITLNDLLDLAGKSEIAVMQLADSCMKFNSRTLKQSAAAVKKQLSQLSDMIRGEIMGNEGGGMKDDKRPALDRNTGEGNLKNSDNVKRFESKKISKLLKSLKEAIDEENEEEKETSSSSLSDKKSTIDLSSAFSNVIDGLSTEQFDVFKSDTVSALKASGVVDGDFLSIVTELEETDNVDDFNITLDSLYDYADKNGIEIKTEGEPSKLTK